MAASGEVLDRLNDQLQCAICLNRYTDPRILQCHHSFCKNCIGLIPVELEDEQQLIRCPMCRKPTQLDDQGVVALSVAFHINSLLEIEELLRKSRHRHVQNCHAHKDRLMDLYCETCEELICVKCSTEFHRDHQYDRAEALFGEHEQQIKAGLLPLKERIAELEHTLTQFEERKTEIRDHEQAVKMEIDETYHQLMNQLQESRRQLTEELFSATQDKLQLLCLQENDAQALLEQLKSCHAFVEDELRSCSQYQIQAAKKWLVKHVNDTHSAVKIGEMQPAQEPNIEFIASPFACTDIGDIRSQLNLSFSDRFWVDIPAYILENEEVEVILIAPIPLLATRLRCQLTPTKHRGRKTPKAIEFQVTKVGKCQFKVMIRSSTGGLHQLRVLVDELDVYGSPFNVNVVGWKRTNLVSFAKVFNEPVGVAVTDDGQYVIVAERRAHQVAVVDSSGTVMIRFGCHGDDPGDFMYPRGVAVSADKHIFVVDSRRLQKFAFPSSYVASFDVVSTGVAVHPDGKYVFCNNANEANVTVLNSEDLTRSHCFGNNGLLLSPYNLAIDTKGMVYVTDNVQGIILKFTPEGEHLATIGSKGSQPDQFGMPLGICIDCNDIMYVTDYYKQQVMVFTTRTEHKFLGSFVGSGIQVLFLRSSLRLHEVAVDKIGNVYVCNVNSDEVLVSRP